MLPWCLTWQDCNWCLFHKHRLVFGRRPGLPSGVYIVPRRQPLADGISRVWPWLLGFFWECNSFTVNCTDVDREGGGGGYTAHLSPFFAPMYMLTVPYVLWTLQIRINFFGVLGGEYPPATVNRTDADRDPYPEAVAVTVTTQLSPFFAPMYMLTVPVSELTLQIRLFGYSPGTSILL